MLDIGEGRRQRRPDSDGLDPAPLAGRSGCPHPASIARCRPLVRLDLPPLTRYSQDGWQPSRHELSVMTLAWIRTLDPRRRTCPTRRSARCGSRTIKQ